MDGVIKALIEMGITPENLVRAFGAVIMLTGLLEPTLFLGVQIPWTTSKRLIATVAGVIVILCTIPQLQFWNWHKVVIERSEVAALDTNVQKGLDSIGEARRQNSFPACFDSASKGSAPLNAAKASLTTLLNNSK